MSTTFHCKRHTSFGDLPNLYWLVWKTSTGQRICIGRGTKLRLRQHHLLCPALRSTQGLGSSSWPSERCPTQTPGNLKPQVQWAMTEDLRLTWVKRLRRGGDRPRDLLTRGLVMRWRGWECTISSEILLAESGVVLQGLSKDESRPQ